MVRALRGLGKPVSQRTLHSMGNATRQSATWSCHRLISGGARLPRNFSVTWYFSGSTGRRSRRSGQHLESIEVDCGSNFAPMKQRMLEGVWGAFMYWVQSRGSTRGPSPSSPVGCLPSVWHPWQASYVRSILRVQRFQYRGVSFRRLKFHSEFSARQILQGAGVRGRIGNGLANRCWPYAIIELAERAESTSVFQAPSLQRTQNEERGKRTP